MNDIQLEQKKEELREEMNANGYGWIDGKFIQPPEEYKKRQTELYCISMINSLLCYNYRGCKNAEDVMRYQETSYKNYLEDYVNVLGRDRVVELIQGQIDSIDSVKVGVFRDGEGCSYNSIIWKEDVKYAS